MADGRTYGINFPFRDSVKGDYLELTEYQFQEVRADLIHLLLTRKGSRYYLPDFGTRLYEYIFEPFDGLTFSAIEADIRDSVTKYMPNLILNKITIEPITSADEVENSSNRETLGDQIWQIYKVPGKGTSEYTAKIKINYSVDGSTFDQSDFVIINI